MSTPQFEPGQLVKYVGKYSTFEGVWEIVGLATIRNMWRVRRPGDYLHNGTLSAKVFGTSLKAMTDLKNEFQPGESIEYTGKLPNLNGTWEVVEFVKTSASGRFHWWKVKRLDENLQPVYAELPNCVMKKIEPKGCTCPISDLMAKGCTCGQMARERKP